jgi:hypothetical protein
LQLDCSSKRSIAARLHLAALDCTSIAARLHLAALDC